VSLMMIRLAINYLVTVIWATIFCTQSPVVCSRVLDLLQPRTPLMASAPSIKLGSGGPTEAALAPVACALFQGPPPKSALFVYPCSYESKRNELASTAIRQQFLFGLLEERRFFAHLVLRCVRAGVDSSAACGPQKSAQVGSMSAKTQPLSKLLMQRSRQNPRAEAGPVSLQTLFADVARRLAQASRSSGGIS
jgi:hypothetical protein